MEFELIEEGGFVRQADGTSQPIIRTRVSLVYPGSDYQARTRIVNISPRTALNLLDWLAQHKDVLEALAES